MMQLTSYAADLSHYTLLSFSGADATAFLHGQLTCDVEGLPADTATYGGYCTAKGRLLAVFLLWREADAWRMLLPRSIAPAIQKRLKMYVLRSKVSVDDLSANMVLLGLGGDQAGQAAESAGVKLPSEPMAVRHGTKGAAVALPDGRWLVSLLAESAPGVRKVLAERLQTIDAAAWEWTDIANGIPTVLPGTQEQFVPQMTNLDRIGGVSFKKGCYPGQEIVARTQYLGKVKRKMMLAHTETAAAAGNDLYSDDVAGQANGMVVNASPAPEGGWDLLAVVQSDSAAQSKVHLGAADGPVLAFRPLPYAAD